MRAPMNLVPPYDVMCLHRHISTSWLFYFLILFQPANENPTWSQSRGAGWSGEGGQRARLFLLVVLAAPSASCNDCSSWQLHQVWFFCGCGRDAREPGQQARVDGSPPPRPGELNTFAVQWTGWFETCSFWMPIKITIWKRPCFCSVCGEASLLCWMSQVLSLIGTRGEDGPLDP